MIYRYGLLGNTVYDFMVILYRLFTTNLRNDYTVFVSYDIDNNQYNDECTKFSLVIFYTLPTSYFCTVARSFVCEQISKYHELSIFDILQMVIITNPYLQTKQ